MIRLQRKALHDRSVASIVVSVLLWLAVCLVPRPAGAQSLEDIDVSTRETSARIVLRFSAELQLILTDRSASRDMIRISYRMIGVHPRDIDPGRTTWRLSPRQHLPPLLIEDRDVAVAGLRELRLTSRQPLDLRVTAGSDGRSLVVWLTTPGRNPPAPAAIEEPAGPIGNAQALARPDESGRAADLRVREDEISIDASMSAYYFGGHGRLRNQDFEDSPISSLPADAAEKTLTAETRRQVIADADLRWRSKGLERELGFVFRDAYLADFARDKRNRHRLTAAYLDYVSYGGKFDLRLGRQSPRGGGVTSRFDGGRLSWRARPDWTLGLAAGLPSEDLLDTQRDFVAASVDIEGILPGMGAGLYLINQRLDGEADRRALGLEGRYLNDGFSMFTHLDYDADFQRSNVASLRGSWMDGDGTGFNFLAERRALTTLSMASSLTFADPGIAVPARSLHERLADTTIEALRADVLATTAYVRQASLGASRALGEHWRASANLQQAETGAIAPLPHLTGFEQGRPASGRTRTTTLAMTGLNLLTRRDINVFSASRISGQTLSGLQIAFSGTYRLGTDWQIEPTLQYYSDESTSGDTTRRMTPSLRFTYRGWKRFSVESNLTWERASSQRHDINDPVQRTEEMTSRVGYSLGLRYDV
ncbi:MAG: hypothetical protein R3E83_16440 [Burkholderiaceae bacterium]